MRFLKWHVLNILSSISAIATLCAVGWVVYLKIYVANDSANFFFKSWWHTGFLLVLIMMLGGLIMDFFDDRKPESHTEKREYSAKRKELKRAESKQIKQEVVYSNTGVLDLIFGGILGFLIGRGGKSRDRYRIETYSSRAKTRGGNSGVVGDRDKAISKGYEWMKRHPLGEVKVIDQKTGHTLLHLP